jgi:hypothetical protein
LLLLFPQIGIVMTHTASHDSAPSYCADRRDHLETRTPWVRPVLTRLGSVAQVTAKIDNAGKWDGVFVIGMSRT